MFTFLAVKGKSYYTNRLSYYMACKKYVHSLVRKKGICPVVYMYTSCAVLSALISVTASILGRSLINEMFSLKGL